MNETESGSISEATPAGVPENAPAEAPGPATAGAAEAAPTAPVAGSAASPASPALACAAPDLAAGDAVVQGRGITREYGEGDAAVHALRGVDVDLARGHLTAIMGPSGSGKSTLMHILAGLDEPTEGTVTVDGVEITGLKERELTQLRRDKIGFIFQTFNLLPTLTAQENIELPATIAGRKGDGEWVGQLVDTVGLADRLDHKPSQLSGGQQQRVAVARALVGRPAVLFADEPTGNLDSKTGDQVLDLLRRSVDDFGQTIVMVTHDAHAASIADRLLFLKDGEIVHDCARMARDEIFEVIKSLEDAR
jgi:putative ABC transport system ATP-binding protein